MKRNIFFSLIVALLMVALFASPSQAASYLDNLVTNGIVMDGVITNDSGAGAIAGSDVTVAEYGNGIMHKTVLTLSSRAIALTDEAGVVAYGGSKLYDFPEGAIMFVGAVSDLDLGISSAGVNDDWDGDVGLGTVTATNDASLTTTEDNIVPTTATPQASGGETTSDFQSTAAENVVVDGTSTAVDLYLNYLVDDADHDVTSTACDLEATGTITVYWINLGDN